IQSAFKTSNTEAEKFTKFYVGYRKSIQTLFDFAHSLPNHHFAMHNEALLKHWGPLAGLSEFPGERMNGMFQKLKTNRRIYNMGYTMLKKLLHFIQFTILTKEYQSTNSEHLQGLYNILQPPAISKSYTKLLLNDQACEAFLTKATPLSPQEYVVLLQYLNQIGRPYRAYTNMPHPEYSLVLPPAAKQLKEFNIREYTYSCKSSHQGNSNIQFQDRFNNCQRTGTIESIFQIPLEGVLQTFLIVQEHMLLPIGEEIKALYIHYPRFKSKIVFASTSNIFFIIEPNHIITHLTTHVQPSGTFGIPYDTLIVCWGLDKGKKC
ncbi:hypothetical protein FB446DRAFT_656003, partial [Lentinula raphanica]